MKQTTVIPSAAKMSYSFGVRSFKLNVKVSPVAFSRHHLQQECTENSWKKKPNLDVNKLTESAFMHLIVLEGTCLMLSLIWAVFAICAPALVNLVNHMCTTTPGSPTSIYHD